MTYKEFVELVAEMRTAQRNYFKTRTQGDLTNSKQLEKLVDNAIVDGMWLPNEPTKREEPEILDLFRKLGL